MNARKVDRGDLTVMAKLEVSGELNTRGGRKEPLRVITFGPDARDAMRKMHRRLGTIIARWDEDG